MNQATAIAHANLAFVKYWGKKDPVLNLPANNSISMNLSAAYTTTTVVFANDLLDDEVQLDGEDADQKFADRVGRHLDRIRQYAGVYTRARVETRNTFPASAGIASSASGFAALTLAAVAALGMELSERELSILARQGSGSACRSIPDGFVEWRTGATNRDSYAESIAPAEHWDLLDVAVIVADQPKGVSSSLGHRLAPDSPFWAMRQAQLPERLEQVRRAIHERDFVTFGQEIETEALSLHAIMLTSAHEVAGSWRSGIYYWLPDTLELLIAVQNWRADGIPVYFTLDAGPTVHLLCPAERGEQVQEAVWLTQGRRNWSMIVSLPAVGARLGGATI